MTFPLSITEVHSCFTFDLNEITDSCADTEKQNNQTITIYFKLQLKIKPVKVLCSTPSTPQASRFCIMSKRYPVCCNWHRSDPSHRFLDQACFLCLSSAPSSQPQHGLAWMEGKGCCCAASMMCIILKIYKTVKSMIFLLLAQIHVLKIHGFVLKCSSCAQSAMVCPNLSQCESFCTAACS